MTLTVPLPVLLALFALASAYVGYRFGVAAGRRTGCRHRWGHATKLLSGGWVRECLDCQHAEMTRNPVPQAGWLPEPGPRPPAPPAPPPRKA